MIVGMGLRVVDPADLELALSALFPQPTEGGFVPIDPSPAHRNSDGDGSGFSARGFVKGAQCRKDLPVEVFVARGTEVDGQKNILGFLGGMADAVISNAVGRS